MIPNIDVSFEASPWEKYLQTKQAGDVIPVMDLLTILEDEDEEMLEEALSQLETGCFRLDLSGLARNCISGEAALRLKQELELAEAEDLNYKTLEPSDPLRLFLEEVSSIPVCGDEQVLAEQYLKGETRVSEMLLNLGLSRVIAIAREHAGYGVLLLDLIQEGSLGLWQAIRNFRCGDYLALRDRWIRFYMAKAIAIQAKSSGIGRKMRSAMEDYQAVDQRLLGDLGRNPTVEEIALEMHMEPEEAEAVKKMLENAQILAKIRKPEPTEEDRKEEDQAVEDTAYFQMRQRILDMLSDLNEDEAKLLTLRFGLEGGQPLSPEEAGKILKLTPSEVVQREAAALQKLRSNQS